MRGVRKIVKYLCIGRNLVWDYSLSCTNSAFREIGEFSAAQAVSVQPAC